MAHALALGALGVVANIAGAWVNWSYGNHWYPIALAPPRYRVRGSAGS
jgi:hypothetical protein